MKSTPFYQDPYVLVAVLAAGTGFGCSVLLRHAPPIWQPDVRALNDFLTTILPLVVIGARAEVGSKLTLTRKEHSDV